MFTHAAVAVVCLTVGWLAGSGWTRVTRGWHDYRTHKAQLPGLLKLARLLSVEAVGWVSLAVVITWYALHVLATEGR